jgi:hypothetical protein
MKYRLWASLLYFALITSLLSQTQWSTPVQLSRDGTYPDLGFIYPAITVDQDGIIHGFWVVDISADGSTVNRFSQIEYRKSNDGGVTWAPTENLTPEYSTERIYNIKAVCDSKGNVHLVYSRGSEACKVLYKKYDGVSWSAPYEIYPSAGSHLRLGIDFKDRIYAVWNTVGNYYSYCDTNQVNPLWSPARRLHPTRDHFLKDMTFDKNNNVHAIGLICEIEDEYRPYYYYFDREIDDWTVCTEISSYKEKALGNAIALSNSDTLYANVAVGNTLCLNTDNHLKKSTNDSLWSIPYAYGNNNNWDREMYIDQNNYLHLFEKHYYQGVTTGDTGLIHSTGKNGVWHSIEIDSEPGYSYTEPSVVFDKQRQIFYTIYYKFDRTNSISRIYFQSKQNDTGIDESDYTIVKDFELHQNYPNPFNNSTQIQFRLEKASNVELNIFNSKGEFVHNLIEDKLNKGNHSYTLKAVEINSGIYFYRLTVDGISSETRKMLYLR